MALIVSEPLPRVTLVTLSNPARRNAFDEATFRDLAALWPMLEAASTRCIVITGAQGHFSSGADLSSGVAAVPDIEMLIDGALLKTKVFSKPIVAAIEGVCVAGGLELALSCDVRICATDSRLGFPEVKWGIYPAGGGAMRLPQEIGHAAAAELLLTGRLFGADEALGWGLVNRVTEPGVVLAEALALAETIAANSPVAVSAVKRYLSAARNPARRLIDMEAELAREVRVSEDAREGGAAFNAKRAPVYGDISVIKGA